MQRELRVSLIQGDTRWHDPEGNRRYYAELARPLRGRTDLVVLNGLSEVPSGLAGALKNFVDEGGSLAVFPATKLDGSGLASLLTPFGISGPSRTDTAAMKVDRIDLDRMQAVELQSHYRHLTAQGISRREAWHKALAEIRAGHMLSGVDLSRLRSAPFIVVYDLDETLYQAFYKSGERGQIGRAHV